MAYNYWAEFRKIDNHIFRFNTRIYVKPIEIVSEEDICIGAVVGKNPGSASSSNINKGLNPLNLNGDILLPTVRNIINDSYINADMKIPHNGFIQILNLFYLCNPNLDEAIKKFKMMKNSQFCASESIKFPWVWFVWGGASESLDIYKERFTRINSKINFYFDKNNQKIISRIPKPQDFPKHTQGLRSEYIINHISHLLRES